MRRGAIYLAGNEACAIPLVPPVPIVPTVWKTSNAWERLRGLLGRPMLGAGQALLIDPCPSVHTLGMAYSLDLVFLDARYRVLKVVEKLPPSRWASAAGARATLELAPGTLDAVMLKVGDRLQWREG